ncbi:MAG: Unknown protein [uncultured Sulfurovum sp.]|uniref:NadR/Ttd14 AAA domain-containing protein n=1 Tax=uncultured Sulfurovum sp. TaxID=269237 RepID=A0A6S6SSB8_9BACT|nr:MAG: Unknown protein [uncultured Sulfurovum sp.]
MKTTIINIYGASGIGKSITACKLYAEMSISRNYGNIELVREFAKDLVWAGDLKTLAHQPSVTNGQVQRQNILLGKVDYIVTDSPLCLGLLYSKEEHLDEVTNVIATEREKYNEVNILLKRSSDIPFNPVGRVHTLEESIAIDCEIKSLLDTQNIPYIELSNKLDVISIIQHIEEVLRNK